MNHFMNFDPHLVRQRNEERLAEVRVVRLERVLREDGDREMGGGELAMKHIVRLVVVVLVMALMMVSMAIPALALFVWVP